MFWAWVPTLVSSMILSSETDDAFEDLLKANKIKYKREKSAPVSFKGEKERRNIPDFIIEDKIIVDLKAKPMILKEDYFQMRRYLVSHKKTWFNC